jgi:hypothetical protein
MANQGKQGAIAYHCRVGGRDEKRFKKPLSEQDALKPDVGKKIKSDRKSSYYPLGHNPGVFAIGSGELCFARLSMPATMERGQVGYLRSVYACFNGTDANEDWVFVGISTSSGWAGDKDQYKNPGDPISVCGRGTFTIRYNSSTNEKIEANQLVCWCMPDKPSADGKIRPLLYGIHPKHVGFMTNHLKNASKAATEIMKRVRSKKTTFERAYKSKINAIFAGDEINGAAMKKQSRLHVLLMNGDRMKGSITQAKLMNAFNLDCDYIFTKFMIHSGKNVERVAHLFALMKLVVTILIHKYLTPDIHTEAALELDAIYAEYIEAFQTALADMSHRNVIGMATKDCAPDGLLDIALGIS